MHVLTPAIFAILTTMLDDPSIPRVSLSSALAVLAAREQYLALVQNGRRYDVGVKYGLFTAQLALALNGQDRDDVLAEMVNVLATRDRSTAKGAGA
jgi:UTP--glucose-1-phosphate uridylyltransferase